MDAKSVRNMQSIIAVTNKHTANLHHVGSLYILRISVVITVNFTARRCQLRSAPVYFQQPSVLCQVLKLAMVRKLGLFFQSLKVKCQNSINKSSSTCSHIHQQMHTIPLQILRNIKKNCYMFRRRYAIYRESQIQKKFKHQHINIEH